MSKYIVDVESFSIDEEEYKKVNVMLTKYKMMRRRKYDKKTLFKRIKMELW